MSSPLCGDAFHCRFIVIYSNNDTSCRMQLDNAEFEGVDIICTRNRLDTVKFLIQQLESFLQSFDPRRPPTKTRQQLKLHIEKQMKAPTLHEYLRLRKIPGIGDAKAMKVCLMYQFSLSC